MSDGRLEAATGRDGGGRPAGGAARQARTWLVWWLVCAGLWMVLDDTASVPELVDGAVAAAIGASAATLTVARSPVAFAMRRSWLRLWWRPLVQFATDLPVLARLLGQALTGGTRDPGAVRAVSFVVEPDRAARAAQVALASVVGSFAPNSVVVAVDEAGGTLIVHELTPGSARAGADPLGLG